MKPQEILTKYPAFQANQVLTASTLNDAVGYLLQQEQHTRNKLIGIGIVCGLTMEKVTTPKLGISIHDGCGISSTGALGLHFQPKINGLPDPYTYARPYKSGVNFIVGNNDEFTGLSGFDNTKIRELVITTEFNKTESTLGGALLTTNDLTDNVVILYFEDFIVAPEGCIDGNCDEKGKNHILNLRPLLVHKSIIDSLLSNNYTNPTPTNKADERKLYADFQQSKLDNDKINYLRVNQLSFNETGRIQLKNVNNVGELQLLFDQAIKGINPLDTTLIQIGQALFRLRNEFAFLFNDQFRLSVSAYFSDATGKLFDTNISTAISVNPNQIQYAYDFVRDVVEAHNDLYEKISDLMAICCPDEWMFPNHLMLGVVDTSPTFSQFDATKFSNPNLKYRHIFSPAFTDVLQRELRDKIYSKIERLNALLNAFDLNAIKNKSIPLILPSFDSSKDMEERVIPAYYNNSATSNLNLYWNFENTKRNKTARNTFFDKFTNENEPFRFDWMKNDFFRIEGHIGKLFATFHPLIENIRKNNNLPFEIKTIALSLAASIHECAMPDLQEDYDFQRRKILAILKRLLKKIIDLFEKTQAKTPGEQDPDKFEEEKKPILELLSIIIKAIQTIIGILQEPCVVNFDYITIKEIYEQIWVLILEYAQKQDKPSTETKTESKENANLAITAINLFLFGSLYKIFVALKHRKELMQVNSVDTLRELATKYSGLEHLAGVRKGETFVIVHDGTTIVADFNLPYQIPCECGCVEESCKNKKPAIVTPIATPMVMFINIPEIQNQPKKVHSISFFEEDLLMGDDAVRKIRFEKNNDETPDFVLEQLSVSKNTPKDDTEITFTYTPDFQKDPNGWHQVKYIIDTENGNAAVGVLFICIVGSKDNPWNVRGMIFNVKLGANSFKPDSSFIDKSQFSAAPTMNFRSVSDGTITTQTVGELKNIQVFKTSRGNEIMIVNDNQGFPQLQIKSLIADGVVEDFEYEVTFNNKTSVGTGKLNVIPNQIPTIPFNRIFEGVVLDNAGKPVANARVFNTTDGKEVFTNEKGMYAMPVKSFGELILVQKDGFDELKLQAGSESKLTMSKKIVKTGIFDSFNNENIINIIGSKNFRTIIK